MFAFQARGWGFNCKRRWFFILHLLLLSAQLSFSFSSFFYDILSNWLSQIIECITESISITTSLVTGIVAFWHVFLLGTIILLTQFTIVASVDVKRKTNTESFKLKRLVIRWRLRNVGFDMQTMASYNGAEPTAFKDFIWFSPFLTSHCGVSAQQYNLDGLRVKAKHFRSLKWHRFRDFIPFCVFLCRLLRLQKTLVFWRTWEEQVSYFSHWSLSLLIKKWFDIEMILRKKPHHGFVIWFASFLRFGWKEIMIFTFYIITIFTVS